MAVVDESGERAQSSMMLQFMSSHLLASKNSVVDVEHEEQTRQFRAKDDESVRVRAPNATISILMDKNQVFSADWQLERLE